MSTERVWGLFFVKASPPPTCLSTLGRSRIHLKFSELQHGVGQRASPNLTLNTKTFLRVRLGYMK